MTKIYYRNLIDTNTSIADDKGRRMLSKALKHYYLNLNGSKILKLSKEKESTNFCVYIPQQPSFKCTNDVCFR